MATKKYQELVKMADEDLYKELEAAQFDYESLKFDHAIKGLESPIDIRHLRRDIARLQTEIRKRELAKMSDDELAKRANIRRRRRKGH